MYSFLRISENYAQVLAFTVGLSALFYIGETWILDMCCKERWVMCQQGRPKHRGDI